MAGDRRYIVCVDFDGVLHSYSSGWASNQPEEKAALIVRDKPVAGAFEWLHAMAFDNRFEVCVYSSRSKFDGAVYAMKRWFLEHDFPPEALSQLQFPTQKPAANMTIDDRAFCFEGDFPSPEWLLRFRPWNKRGVKIDEG
jgi:hypothetical protein